MAAVVDVASNASINPAKISIRRRWRGFSDSGTDFQEAIEPGRGVNCASDGIHPDLFWFARTRSR